MPYYVFECPECEQEEELFITYQNYDRIKDDNLNFRCKNNREHILVPVLRPTPFHLKGYGFYTTDNRDAGERYSFDHFDGSGTNAEMKAMDRRIKHPESTIPKGE